MAELEDINLNANEKRVNSSSFSATVQELGDLVESRDPQQLASLGGVEAVAEALNVDLKTGLAGDEMDLERRRKK
jgi:hypothetical protein